MGWNWVSAKPKAPKVSEDYSSPLAAAEGCMNGAIIVLPIWAVIILAIIGIVKAFKGG